MLCSITEKFCTNPKQQTNRRILIANCGHGEKSNSKWIEKSRLSNQFDYTSSKAPDLCSMFKMLRKAARRREVACHTEPEVGRASKSFAFRQCLSKTSITIFIIPILQKISLLMFGVLPSQFCVL